MGKDSISYAKEVQESSYDIIWGYHPVRCLGTIINITSSSRQGGKKLKSL